MEFCSSGKGSQHATQHVRRPRFGPGHAALRQIRDVVKQTYKLTPGTRKQISTRKTRRKKKWNTEHCVGNTIQKNFLGRAKKGGHKHRREQEKENRLHSQMFREVIAIFQLTREKKCLSMCKPLRSSRTIVQIVWPV